MKEKNENENEMSWSKERLEKVMKDRKIEREKMREECIIGVVESDEKMSEDEYERELQSFEEVSEEINEYVDRMNKKKEEYESAVRDYINMLVNMSVRKGRLMIYCEMNEEI